MRIGAMIGGREDLEGLVARTQELEAAGFDSVWMPNVFGLDAMGAFTVIGRETERIELGTAVVPTYPRHPVTMAQQALTVQAASGNRFALGIGLSHKFVIEDMWGMSFDRPARHMRDYLEALLPLLRGGEVNVENERYRIHATYGVPGAEPPPVLLAQPLFAAGEPARVVELLRKPLAGRPDYTAGQLVFARSAELVGDAVAGFGAYLGIAELDREAAARAPALRARAVLELGERVGRAIGEGRLAEAGAALAMLRTWAGDEAATVDLRRRLARAGGNAEEELEATRVLIAAGDRSLELLQRQAALEVEMGDARLGLDLYEQLAERHPENVDIAAALTAARFTWRTKLLPDRVARLLDASSLLRGDFAALTYLARGGRTDRIGRRYRDRQRHRGASTAKGDRPGAESGPHGAGRSGGAAVRSQRLHAARRGAGRPASHAGPARQRRRLCRGCRRSGARGHGVRVRGSASLPVDLRTGGVPAPGGDLGPRSRRGPAPDPPSDPVVDLSRAGDTAKPPVTLRETAP